ncbi:MAG: hypothetical protein EOO10_02485 [Chitinophagaceae bacterium]|nr:MAG: hypothetical protein EOO10_02485 [Chitinophagaceae bacterium]
MKTILLTFLFLSFSFSLLAGTVTALTTIASPGDWTTGTTWSSGTVPTSGDLVIIPGGKAVVIASQVYGGTSPTLIVIVNGTLNFEPSGKLNLSALSSIQLSVGGKISPKNSSASQLITIGGILKYSAANNGALIGPAIADVLSGLSVPGQPFSGFNPYTLPVYLENFTVSQKSNMVIVHWQTTAASAVNRFEVQRSEDNGHSWQTAGSLPVRSNGIYEFEELLPSTGTILYRLQISEENGAWLYSNVVSFSRKVPADVKLFPNPTTGKLQFSFPASLSGPATMQFANLAGNMAKQIALTGLQRSYQLDIGDLTKGLYHVTILQAGKRLFAGTILLQ